MGGSSAQPAESGPPKYVAPYIQDVLKEAGNQYRNYTPQYYPDSTVIKQSDWTQQGLQGLAGFGNSQWNQGVLGGAAGSQNTLTGASNPFYNPVYGAGLSQLPQNLQSLSFAQQQGMQGLQQGPYTDIQGLSGQTLGNTIGAVNQQLSQVPGQNPYVDELVRRTLGANTLNFNQSVLPQIDNASQAAGGYGGSRQGVAQGLAIQGLNTANANTANQIYSGQYNADLQRQLQAAGLGAQIAGQGSSAQLQGLGQEQQYNLGLQGQGLTAAGMGLANLQQGYGQGIDAATRNLALANQTQALGQTGINTQLAAGSAQDQYQQAVLQSLIDRFNWEQNLPYQKLDKYAGYAFGSPAQSSTGAQAGGGGAAGAAGGALAGAYMGSQIYPGWGTVIGGIIGALGGAFA